MSVAKPGRREQNRLEKTEAICEHALQMVEHEGIGGLTIGRLAKRMDWAMGALYRYFPSKDALFIELQSRVTRSHGDALRVGLDALPDRFGPVARLVYCARHYYEWFSRRRGHASLIAMSLAHPKQLIDDAQGQHVFRAAFGSLQRTSSNFALAEAEGSLVPGSAAERTVVLWASLMGLMQVEKLSRFAPEVIDVPRLIDEAVGALLVGWGAPREAVECARAELPAVVETLDIDTGARAPAAFEVVK